MVLKKSPADWSKVTDFLLNTNNVDEDACGEIEDSLGIFINESRQAMENTEGWTAESVIARLEAVTDFLGKDAIRNVYQQYRQGTYFDDLLNSLARQLSDRLATMNWKDAILDFEGHDSIPIMTLHKSKGLEFHAVVFIGLEDQALWGYDNSKRSGKCILSLRRDFGILTFVIVILLETGAGDYGCQKKKTYQAGLVSGF